MKWVSILVVYILLSSNGFSAKLIYCPNVTDIKNRNLHGWLAFYRKGETLATSEDVKKFRAAITNFESGEWNNHFFATGHCNYQGIDPIVHEIILGKQPWSPAKNNYWKWIKKDEYAICQSNDINQCGFIP